MDEQGSPFRGILIAVAVMVGVYIGVGAACTKAFAEPTYREVQAVNRAVNREYAPRMAWDDPQDGVWDCENYAGAKRDRLAAMGMPREAMRTFYVFTSSGEAHAVLEVQTERGPVILDNLSPWLIPTAQAQTFYTGWKRLFVMRQDISAR